MSAPRPGPAATTPAPTLLLAVIPRKRESTPPASTTCVDSRFRGNDGQAASIARFRPAPFAA
jgi:hypothetical protein